MKLGTLALTASASGLPGAPPMQAGQLLDKRERSSIVNQPIRKSAVCAALIAAAFSLTAPTAQAGTTINFDTSVGYGPVSNPVIVDGYQLTTINSLLSTAPSQPLFFNGSYDLFNNIPGEAIQLTQVGGGAFSVLSIDIAPLFNAANFIGTNITFTGSLVGGGSVIDTVTMTSNNLTTYVLGGMSNVSTFTWNQGSTFDGDHQFGNFVVSTSSSTPTPETGMMAILGIGLAGLFGSRSRRIRRALRK